jgi:hypothetical protein
MRCSCAVCGTYMVHHDNSYFECICPQCANNCRVCLGEGYGKPAVYRLGRTVFAVSYFDRRDSPKLSLLPGFALQGRSTEQGCFVAVLKQPHIRIWEAEPRILEYTMSKPSKYQGRYFGATYSKDQESRQIAQYIGELSEAKFDVCLVRCW